ncbi:MAG: cytochrome c, partial [Hyphomicrobiaceae bacterium]
MSWLQARKACSILACLSLLGAAASATERETWLLNLVRQDCGSCHGMTMKGGLGRPLVPERLAGTSTEGLAMIILEGVPGTPMPPWRGLLT